MAADRGSEPDVEIAATVSAKELQLHVRPSVVVRVEGGGRCGPGQETVRENLDSPVEPGRPYRRIRVSTRIMGYLRTLR